MKKKIKKSKLNKIIIRMLCNRYKFIKRKYNKKL